MKALIIFLIIILSLYSCSKKPLETEQKRAFFVAGHTYGKPGTTEKGFHPPFRNEFNFIQTYSGVSFGILTGDIVQSSDEESWDAIDEELKELGMPVFFAPGNHDTYDYELYKRRYGDPDNDYKTFGYFLEFKNLFILLDANLDNWNISDDQLSFLTDVLDEHVSQINNVFIFMHQLIWWDEHTVFKNIVLNWPPYTPDTTNYWCTIEPMLQNYPKRVCLIAGDLGASNAAEPFMYYKDSNITYIASGMGSGVNDNYLFVEIDESGIVNFNLIALQGERDRLGMLEDYTLP